jgi:uncharacterized SAM-binding protein YcdF (DUF218 family)
MPGDPPPFAGTRLVGGLLRLAVAVGLGAAATLAAGFWMFVAHIERDEPEPRATADAIVVLTGGSDRIPDAVQLLAEGRGKRLLITGVDRQASPRAVARLMPDHGDLFGCCVDLDYGASNTIGNAIETRRWVRAHAIRSLIVVTSNYHMPRALIELRRAMPDVRFIPRPVVPYGFDAGGWWRDPVAARLLAVEYAKFLAASLRAMALPDIDG